MSNAKVEVGQVRLIPSIGRKVLVVANWTDDRWLVSPISENDIPLVQGELLSEFGVFQLWNTRIFEGAEFVQMSELVGSVPEEVVGDAYDVFTYIISGYRDLTPELSKRIGPPILDDDDPRVEYQDKETHLFHKFLSLS